MIRKISLFLILLLSALSGYGQVELEKEAGNDHGPGVKNGFNFTRVIDLETTSIKDQGASGTCWSYSANSFLESEMIRKGKDPVDLAEIYTARNSYIEKAKNYVRMHGAINWGDGGEPHDVINMYAKYGALPQAVYSGLHYGTDINRFSEMQTILKSMLDAIVDDPNGTLTPVWKKAFISVLDTYLGKVPNTFYYNGKTYTSQTFANEVVGLNPDDYVEFISETDHSYFQKAVMMVPDNWALQQDWNIPMDDLTNIVDNALKNGYTVVWGTDVSEPYFSWKNGIAYVPEMPIDAMTDEQKEELFSGPQPERDITPEMRQRAFDNYNTTDDHGMQIIGLVKDQNGKEYYKIKNSWGTDNDYNGYLYVTKNYLKYKTTSILVNKNSLPESLVKKINGSEEVKATARLHTSQ